MTNKAKRVLKRLKDRKAIEEILERFNQEMLDGPPSPVAGKEQEMGVLKEMNELQEWTNDV